MLINIRKDREEVEAGRVGERGRGGSNESERDLGGGVRVAVET